MQKPVNRFDSISHCAIVLMKDLQKCEVSTNEKFLKKRVLRACGALVLDALVLSTDEKSQLLAAGTPYYNNYIDTWQWMQHEIQQARLSVAAFPPPTNRAIADACQIHRKFPTRDQFYATVAYLVLVVWKLSNKAELFFNAMERAWSFHSERS